MIRIFLFALISILSISGCGYKFTVKTYLPIGTDKIYVEIFKNETHEVGLESLLTSQFVEQIARHLPIGTISKSITSSTHIVEGEIKSLYTDSIFYNENPSCASHKKARQRIVVIARLRLLNHKREIILSTGEIKESHYYDSILDDSKNRSRRQEAIFIVIEKLSKAAFRRLTGNF